MSPSDRVSPLPCQAPPPPGTRSFDFAKDTVSFPNELVWRYAFDPVTGARSISRNVPAPSYAHRCFILARAVHLFFRHARFRPDLPALPPNDLYQRLRAVLTRDPRHRCLADEDRIVIPGWPDLRTLSRANEPLLKRAGGGAWRSYVVRSHWRMVFPLSRSHQARTAQSLASALRPGETRILHIVRFPSLTINHALVLYAVEPVSHGLTFTAYDPNRTEGPVTVDYSAAERTFTFPANDYWPGGRIDVIAIFQSWLL